MGRYVDAMNKFVNHTIDGLERRYVRRRSIAHCDDERFHGTGSGAPAPGRGTEEEESIGVAPQREEGLPWCEIREASRPPPRTVTGR